jgi:hypothetical protein
MVAQPTSAHLLGKHDSAGRDSGSSETRYSEELGETGNVVVSDRVGTGLGTKLSMDVVEIAGSLKLSITEALEGRIGLLHLALLDVPSWTLEVVN